MQRVFAIAGTAVVMIVVSSCSIANPIATVTGISSRSFGSRSTAKAGASGSAADGTRSPFSFEAARPACTSLLRTPVSYQMAPDGSIGVH